MASLHDVVGRLLAPTGYEGFAPLQKVKLRKYADEHHGEFPLNLKQAAPWLPKALEADASPSANAPQAGRLSFKHKNKSFVRFVLLCGA